VLALQVKKEDTWHAVIPEPDAFIVNMGDMIQVWSNARFQATEYRVNASSNRVRYSVLCFYNPSYQTVILPLVDKRELARYRLIPWDEYRSGRAAGNQGEEIQIAWYRN